MKALSFDLSKPAVEFSTDNNPAGIAFVYFK